MMHIKLDENLYLVQGEFFKSENSLFNFFVDIEKNQVNFSEVFNGKCVYLSYFYPKDSLEIEIKPNEILRPNKKSKIINSVYLIASHFVKNKNYIVLEKLIKTLGDQHFLDLFKNNILDKLEKEMFKASYDRSLRMLEGNISLEKMNLDLVDLIYLLAEDNEFKVLYNNLNIPNFKFNKDKLCDCLGLVWNSDLLNLSLKIKIDGLVELPEGFENFNIEKDYPTFIYRNLPIIKNNKINSNKIKFTCSENTFKILLKNNILENENYSKDNIYTLNLEKINKIEKFDEFFCLNIFSEKLIKLTKKEASLKILKEKITKKNSPTEDSLSSLLSNAGITKNGYIYKKENSEDVFLEVIEFKSYLKGISSLPKTSDVIKKISENKKITPREKILVEALNEYSSYSESENIKEIMAEIEKTKKEILYLEKDINKNKMYFIENNTWFNNLDSKQKCIDHPYEEFTISIEVNNKQVKK